MASLVSGENRNALQHSSTIRQLYGSRNVSHSILRVDKIGRGSERKRKTRQNLESDRGNLKDLIIIFVLSVLLLLFSVENISKSRDPWCVGVCFFMDSLTGLHGTYNSMLVPNG